MALSAGTIYFTLEFAKDLKDQDWFGKQDPYCILQCGNQTVRTRTAVDGGKNPVWNETFQFQVVNENNVAITIKDEDVGRDDIIGTAFFSLARAREQKHDHVQIPVQTKHGKQKGLISASIRFESNNSLKPAQQPVPQQPYPYPAAGYAPPAYPPQPYGAPPPQYAPQYAPPAPGYGAPPMPYAAAPPAPGYGVQAPPYPQYPQQYPPQYPPQQYPPQYPPRPY